MIELLKSRNIKVFTPNGITDGIKDKIKYHYTSTSGLLSILKCGTIRFTDARFMNDKSELLYFIDILADFLKENDGYPKCVEAFEKLLLDGNSLDTYKKADISTLQFNGIDILKGKKIRQFVFCLSKSKDSLNMWNYYTHSNNYQGYNIGIKVEEFLKTFEKRCLLPIDPFYIYYGKVVYVENNQKQGIIREICNDLESQDLPMELRILSLSEYITSNGLFYKNKAFKNEEEYRVVIAVSEDTLHSTTRNYGKDVENSDFKLDFYERNGVVVPCLSVRFDKISIKSIMIAPTIDEKLASSSLEEFLEINGYKAKVSNSKIPIRF